MIVIITSGDLSIKAFISDLANPVYAPGGGAASALAAALSSALVSMAASLTANNPRFDAFRDDLTSASVRLRELNTDLINLIDRDAEAFEPLSKVYKLPKDTEGYAEIRHAAVLFACSVPADILRCISEICSILEDVKNKCSPSIIPDVCCAAYLSAAAAECAAVTVFSNTKMINGTDDARRIEAETVRIKGEICSACESTASVFLNRISPEVH
ncbi:MAG: cyclodeaminase/cyclohydrolase family protein [Oscillospiraceae bacterium]|nr:cyclodeaminase/cyclohydrolase family protein [Oscillospiraceae bacterium]